MISSVWFYSFFFYLDCWIVSLTIIHLKGSNWVAILIWSAQFSWHSPFIYGPTIGECGSARSYSTWRGWMWWCINTQSVIVWKTTITTFFLLLSSWRLRESETPLLIMCGDFVSCSLFGVYTMEVESDRIVFCFIRTCLNVGSTF